MIEIIIIKTILGIVIVLGCIMMLKLLIEFSDWLKEKTGFNLIVWIITSCIIIAFLILCFYTGEYILQWLLM